MNYSPISGLLLCKYQTNSQIILCDYNYKSKDGSSVAIVTEDMKLSLIITEQLTIIRTTTIDYNKLQIKESSRILSLNYKLRDSILLGYSDGSIIKLKYNEEPKNLIYQISNKKVITSEEEEFQNIKSIFSTDYSLSSIDASRDHNYIELMLVSFRYKTLFVFQKCNVGINKVNIFCLRTNHFEREFCRVDGVVNCADLIDKKDLLLVVTFNVENKKTSLEIWNYSDGSCPVAFFNLSCLLDFSFTIKCMGVTEMPDRYYGRNTNHGIVDWDMVFFGTTKGDVIVGKICNLVSNNKIGFQPVNIYKLKNNPLCGDQMSSKYEVSFLSFDLYFDVLMLGDISSNVRFFEKILQIGKSQSNEENLPFFSLFYQPKISYIEDYHFHHELPIFSVKHDLIKDRSIIIYDQGRDLVISTLNDESFDGVTSDRNNFGDLNLKNI